jgi:hypothetical protein
MKLPQDPEPFVLAAAIIVPDEGIAAIPDEGIAAIPDEGVAAIPDEGIAAIPDEGVAAIPDEGVAAIPDEGIAAANNLDCDVDSRYPASHKDDEYHNNRATHPEPLVLAAATPDKLQKHY